ncbi:hypothetical protein LEP1GSC173_3768 [Leptospira interrogans str. HAI1594]|nr:hypothetical protein LEP1GSC173_3768 [Leptospira interrogans str. HAI1594]EMO18260.1 hypothetical protein LEP1GSC167_3849 [Leptospira interrogans serovar Copenhageni str. HAI0188]
MIFQFHWMNANLQDRRFFTFSIGFKNVSRKQEFHKRNRSLPNKLK